MEPLDRNVWPKTITIDFGNGCEVRDSIVKKGKIIIKQSAPRNTDSWEKVVTFDGYAVNNTQIEGTHTISFSLESGNPVWTSVITGSKITKEDGTVITREATYVREQIAGTETPRNRFDNIYLLTGDASGVNCNGDSYTSIITKPLVINMGCRWIQEGTKEIHIGDKPLITLDFGDGTCDNKATLTQNGETREIILRGMRRR
ncbi:MAG: hypothetical protein J7L89_07620 [Bacteroidales bacterium]|nr:hypothetical protein [Bacteroidales bacterium]